MKAWYATLQQFFLMYGHGPESLCATPMVLEEAAIICAGSQRLPFWNVGTISRQCEHWASSKVQILPSRSADAKKICKKSFGLKCKASQIFQDYPKISTRIPKIVSCLLRCWLAAMSKLSKEGPVDFRLSDPQVYLAYGAVEVPQ